MVTALGKELTPDKVLTPKEYEEMWKKSPISHVEKVREIDFSLVFRLAEIFGFRSKRR